MNIFFTRVVANVPFQKLIIVDFYMIQIKIHNTVQFTTYIYWYLRCDQKFVKSGLLPRKYYQKEKKNIFTNTNLF